MEALRGTPATTRWRLAGLVGAAAWSFGQEHHWPALVVLLFGALAAAGREAWPARAPRA